MIKPGLSWVRKATLMAILTHPQVTNAKVYYPGSTELVTIDRGRMFGGAELIEPGLTLSVHPYHASLSPIKGQYSTKKKGNGTVEYASNLRGNDTLSTGDSYDRGYSTIYNLVVQLFYRDSGLNVPEDMYAQTKSRLGTTYHGYNVEYTEGANDKASLDMSGGDYLTTRTIEVQTLPGEEVLCKWMDIIKDVIRDIKVLYPFTNFRNPALYTSDCPTTTWLGFSANLVFHTAYHIIQWDVLEPAADRPQYPNVQEYFINSTEKSFYDYL